MLRRPFFIVLCALAAVAGCETVLDPVGPPHITDSGPDPVFGITQLYPSLPGGKAWYSRWHDGVARTFTGIDPQDPWFDAAHGDGELATDGDGVLRISGSAPRMFVHDPEHLDQWRGVEITMYFRRRAAFTCGLEYSGMSAVARTNHGTIGDENTHPCDARGLGARLRCDGHIDLEKETSFGASSAIEDTLRWPDGLPQDRWIGYKHVIYDGPVEVIQELWIDESSEGANGGEWRPLLAHMDVGEDFGVGGLACAEGIDPALPLRGEATRTGSESGLPNITVVFRADAVGVNGLEYRDGSVREIVSPPPPIIP